MSMEKGFKHWHTDIAATDTPLEGTCYVLIPYIARWDKVSDHFFIFLFMIASGYEFYMQIKTQLYWTIRAAATEGLAFGETACYLYSPLICAPAW